MDIYGTSAAVGNSLFFLWFCRAIVSIEEHKNMVR